MFSAAFFAASIFGAPAEAPAANGERKPNILVIVADDLGYVDLGFQGGKDIPTPNLDALAEAIACTARSGYVSGPYCSPTRAGLLTGRYQQRFGHEFNPGTPVDGKPVGLDLSQKTIADRLKSAGYATGARRQVAPRQRARSSARNQRGFDEFFGFLGGAHDYFKTGAGQFVAPQQRADPSRGLPDGRLRTRGGGVHRPQREIAVLPLPGLQRGPHADAGEAGGLNRNSPPSRTRRAAPTRRCSAAWIDAIGRVLGKARTPPGSTTTRWSSSSATTAVRRETGLPTARCTASRRRRGKAACACRSSSVGRANCRKAQSTTIR